MTRSSWAPVWVLTTPENTINYQNALCLSPQNFNSGRRWLGTFWAVLHQILPISIVFSFSWGPWGHFNSQETLKTMRIQNFVVTRSPSNLMGSWVTNKEHYGQTTSSLSFFCSPSSKTRDKQMATRVTDGARLQSLFSSRAAALVSRVSRLRCSRARALLSLNLKKKRLLAV